MSLSNNLFKNGKQKLGEKVEEEEDGFVCLEVIVLKRVNECE